MKIPNPLGWLLLIGQFAALPAAPAEEVKTAPQQEKTVAQQEKNEQRLQVLLQSPWQQVFSDPGTGDWRACWFLDGEKAQVSNSPEGLTLDASDGYAVLWTEASFAGDLRLEYDFRRLDSLNEGVNIVYLQATGDGQEGHDANIKLWSAQRKQAAMRSYFQNMHTYHISYAAYPGDYLRGRRYLPLANQGLKGTELTGEIQPTGLFDDQRWIHVTILKQSKELLVRFVHPEKTVTCHMGNPDKPGIDRGRVGMRLMPGRRSQFKNLRIYEAANP
jgi:hypothetical protein